MWDGEVEELLEPHDRRTFLKGAGATGITALAGCAGGDGGGSNGGQNDGTGAGTGTQPDGTGGGGTAGSGSGGGSSTDGGTTTTAGSGGSTSTRAKEFPLSDDPSNYELLEAMMVIDDLVEPGAELPGWGDEDQYRMGVSDIEEYEANGGTTEVTVNGRVLDAMGLWDDVINVAGYRAQPQLFRMDGGAPDVGSVEKGPDLTFETDIQGFPIYTGTFEGKLGEINAAIAQGENYLLVQRGIGGETKTDDLLESMGYQIGHILSEGNPTFEDRPECEEAARDSNPYTGAYLTLLPDNVTRAAFISINEAEPENKAVEYTFEGGEVRESPK